MPVPSTGAVKESTSSGRRPRSEYASPRRSVSPRVSSMATALVTARSAPSRRPGSVRVPELKIFANTASRNRCCRRARAQAPPAGARGRAARANDLRAARLGERLLPPHAVEVPAGQAVALAEVPARLVAVEVVDPRREGVGAVARGLGDDDVHPAQVVGDLGDALEVDGHVVVDADLGQLLDGPYEPRRPAARGSGGAPGPAGPR